MDVDLFSRAVVALEGIAAHFKRSEAKPLDQSMRAKQLASTVRQGRAITVSILDEGPYTGYLCGWDEDSYFVICPPMGDDPQVKMLIPKSAVLFISLHDDQTFREEDDYLSMDKVVKPFREWINNKYFDNNK